MALTLSRRSTHPKTTSTCWIPDWWTESRGRAWRTKTLHCHAYKTRFTDRNHKELALNWGVTSAKFRMAVNKEFEKDMFLPFQQIQYFLAPNLKSWKAWTVKDSCVRLNTEDLKHQPDPLAFVLEVPIQMLKRLFGDSCINGAQHSLKYKNMQPALIFWSWLLSEAGRCLFVGRSCDQEQHGAALDMASSASARPLGALKAAPARDQSRKGLPLSPQKISKSSTQKAG